MHKKWIVLSLIAAFATTSCFLNVNNINIPSGPEPLEEKTVMGDGHDKIVLMDLTGVISDEERSQTFTTMPSLVAEMKEALDKAAGDARGPKLDLGTGGTCQAKPGVPGVPKHSWGTR